jgi:hypothetical protein
MIVLLKHVKVCNIFFLCLHDLIEFLHLETQLMPKLFKIKRFFKSQLFLFIFIYFSDTVVEKAVTSVLAAQTQSSVVGIFFFFFVKKK